MGADWAIVAEIQEKSARFAQQARSSTTLPHHSVDAVFLDSTRGLLSPDAASPTDATRLVVTTTRGSAASRRIAEPNGTVRELLVEAGIPK